MRTYTGKQGTIMDPKKDRKKTCMLKREKRKLKQRKGHPSYTCSWLSCKHGQTTFEPTVRGEQEIKWANRIWKWAITGVDAQFCPGYLFLLFLGLGPICDEVRTWALNFVFFLFIYFYRVFESFCISYLCRVFSYLFTSNVILFFNRVV